MAAPKEIVLQSTPRWKSVTFLKFFEKAGFQFSCGLSLLGNTVPHYALVDHPDVHDNTAVLSQSRYALLRGDQVIPDQYGECHTSVCRWCYSRTFQQQIAKDVQEKQKAIEQLLVLIYMR